MLSMRFGHSLRRDIAAAKIGKLIFKRNRRSRLRHDEIPLPRGRSEKYGQTETVNSCARRQQLSDACGVYPDVCDKGNPRAIGRAFVNPQSDPGGVRCDLGAQLSRNLCATLTRDGCDKGNSGAIELVVMHQGADLDGVEADSHCDLGKQLGESTCATRM